MRKFNAEVKVVNRILYSQRNQLQNDINNLEELKDKKYDLDDIYTKTDYELSKNGKQINIKSLGKKNYDLSKKYGSEPRRISPYICRNGFTNLNNLEHNYISVSDTEQKFQLFKIYG